MGQDKSYLPLNPYRGIESFRYTDRNIFSERNDEKVQLYNLINVYKGCLLYGQSGTGKSSLIGAGLIPMLEPHYQPEIVSVFPSKTGTFIVSKILIDEEEKIYRQSIFETKKNNEAKISLSFAEFEKKVFE